MTQWQVTTANKKSVEEHEFWTKDNQTIIRITGFRWGSWIVTTCSSDPPKFDQVDGPWNNSVDMYSCGYDSELVSLDEGCYSDIVWPDEMSQSDRDQLEELWDKEYHSAWEEAGWYNNDIQCWVWADLDVLPVTE